MDNNSCAAGSGEKKECSVKAFVIPMLVVWGIIFLYEWVFHGILMMPSYQATASLWHTPEDMQNYFYIGMIRQFISAALITCLYCCIVKGCPSGGKCPVTGAKFGFKIGLLIGIVQFGMHAYMPIPMQMAVSWLAGQVLLGITLGVVLSYICRMCKKGNCDTPKV